MNILIVDDHQLFRQGIANLIRSFQSSTTILESSNGEDAVQLIRVQHIDVVLLDIQMHGMSGIETLKQIRAINRDVKVIMLTQFDEKALVVYLLQLGANGYLIKSCGGDELEKTIAQVVEKGHYYDDQILQAIEFNMSQTSRSSNLDLTPRELQVMSLLKEGMSNKEIASQLGLSIRTIESYRKELLKRTGCKNTVELISLGFRTGIL